MNAYTMKPDATRKLTGRAPFAVIAGRGVVDADGRHVLTCNARRMMGADGNVSESFDSPALSPCEADANAHAVCAMLNAHAREPNAAPEFRAEGTELVGHDWDNGPQAWTVIRSQGEEWVCIADPAHAEDIAAKLSAAYNPNPVKLWIVLGESPEPGTRPTEYTFNTEAERAAFLQGVEAMDGWAGYEVTDGPGYRVNADGEVVEVRKRGPRKGKAP